MFIDKKAYGSVRIPILFYQSSYRCKGENHTLELAGSIEKSVFYMEGKTNSMQIFTSEIANSSINITGINNQFTCEEGVKLRNANIIIRGNNCKIIIGKNTTFGGVRIVNVGTMNNIIIGKDCLFSDHIEIWASDTHPIYNEHMEIINTEKPIHIGDSVWVGARVIILKGVHIDSGSIIGMGSLVVNDVSASSISVGIPNKTIKTNVKWSLHY